MVSPRARLIYFPSRDVTATPAQVGLPFEDVRIDSDPGVVLQAWVVRSNPSALWVLCFHGNGGNIADRLDELTFFHTLGVNVVAFDYRGYGLSTGSPTEAGLYD